MTYTIGQHRTHTVLKYFSSDTSSTVDLCNVVFLDGKPIYYFYNDHVLRGHNGSEYNIPLLSSNTTCKLYEYGWTMNVSNNQLLPLIINSVGNNMLYRAIRHCAIRDRLGVKILYLMGKIDVSYKICPIFDDRHRLIPYEHLCNVNIHNWIEIIQLFPNNKSISSKAIALVGHYKVQRHTWGDSATPLDTSSPWEILSLILPSKCEHESYKHPLFGYEDKLRDVSIENAREKYNRLKQKFIRKLASRSDY